MHWATGTSFIGKFVRPCLDVRAFGFWRESEVLGGGRSTQVVQRGNTGNATFAVRSGKYDLSSLVYALNRYHDQLVYSGLFYSGS